MFQGRFAEPPEPHGFDSEIVMEAEQEAMAVAIEEAARGASTDDGRRRLYELLLGARVLVATGPDSPTIGGRTLKEGERLALWTLADEHGNKILLVFTRLSALRTWLKGNTSGYLVLEMKRLLCSVAVGHPGSNILINPGAPGWIALNAQEIAHLAHGRIPTPAGGEVVAETSVQIAPVATLPPEPLLGALRGALASQPAIEAAWAYRMRQGSLPPETVIGLALAMGSTRETESTVVQEVIALATTACEEAKPLAYAVVTEGTRLMLEGGSGLELYRR